MSSFNHSFSSDNSEEGELPDLASRIEKRFGYGFSTNFLERKRQSVTSSQSNCVKLYELSSSDDEDPNIVDFTFVKKDEELETVFQNSSNPYNNDAVSSKIIDKFPEKMNKKELKEAERKKKALEKEHKQAEREKKTLEKEEKQKMKLAKNALKPGECTKYLVIHIDKSLLEVAEGTELTNVFMKSGFQYKIIDASVPMSIVFYRQDPISCQTKQEGEAIVIVPKDEFLALVENEINKNTSAFMPSLCKACREWKRKLAVSSVTFIVFGLDEYFRKQKLKTNRNFRADVLKKATKKRKHSDDVDCQVSRVDIERALISAQVQGTNYRFFESSLKIAEFVSQVAKAIAERPFKLQKNETPFSWYVEGSNINPVKIDKTGVGLLKLWHQQLRQFNHVGVETAQAIAKEYPSPLSLYEGFQSQPTDKAGLLLADIPVRRGTGPLVNTRRIGPELSKKIHSFFTCSNANTVLGQED